LGHARIEVVANFWPPHLVTL